MKQVPLYIRNLNRFDGVYAGQDNSRNVSYLLGFIDFMENFAVFVVPGFSFIAIATIGLSRIFLSSIIPMITFSIVTAATKFDPDLLERKIEKKKQKDPSKDWRLEEILIKDANNPKLKVIPLLCAACIFVAVLIQPLAAIVYLLLVLFKTPIQKHMIPLYCDLYKRKQHYENQMIIHNAWEEFGSWILNEKLSLQHPKDVAALYGKFLASKEKPVDPPDSEEKSTDAPVSE